MSLKLFGAPGTGLDALRAVNPLGQIPTLVRLDGTVLTESAASPSSIDLQYPEAALLPADPVARALDTVRAEGARDACDPCARSLA